MFTGQFKEVKGHHFNLHKQKRFLCCCFQDVVPFAFLLVKTRKCQKCRVSFETCRDRVLWRKRSTHVKASEPTFSSSLWSWYSWLVVCSFSKWCWSSSFRRAFLCWSTCICAFFSFSQSCDLRWRRFSRWTMNNCPSLNSGRQTLVTNTSSAIRIG